MALVLEAWISDTSLSLVPGHDVKLRPVLCATLNDGLMKGVRKSALRSHVLPLQRILISDPLWALLLEVAVRSVSYECLLASGHSPGVDAFSLRQGMGGQGITAKPFR